jgi:hypothetical protein
MSENALILLIVFMPIVAFLYASVGHGGASSYITLLTLAGIASAQVKPTALIYHACCVFNSRFLFWGTYSRKRKFIPSNIGCFAFVSNCAFFEFISNFSNRECKTVYLVTANFRSIHRIDFWYDRYWWRYYFVANFVAVWLDKFEGNICLECLVYFCKLMCGVGCKTYPFFNK